MKHRRRDIRYVVCLRNDGYEASLIDRRVYRQLPDADAEGHGMVRVIDESGDDYLYPKKLFTNVDLPGAAARLFAA